MVSKKGVAERSVCRRRGRCPAVSPQQLLGSARSLTPPCPLPVPTSLYGAAESTEAATRLPKGRTAGVTAPSPAPAETGPQPGAAASEITTGTTWKPPAGSERGVVRVRRR